MCETLAEWKTVLGVDDLEQWHVMVFRNCKIASRIPRAEQDAEAKLFDELAQEM